MARSSAACSAGYQLMTRRLAGQDHAETTNIWSGLVGSCVMVAMSPFFFTLPTRWQDWALFLSMGIIGGTPLMELYLMFHAAKGEIEKHGFRLARSLVGNYVTSLEMAGCSITLSLLDDEIARNWDAPVHTAGLRWGL